MEEMENTFPTPSNRPQPIVVEQASVVADDVPLLDNDIFNGESNDQTDGGAIQVPISEELRGEITVSVPVDTQLILPTGSSIIVTPQEDYDDPDIVGNVVDITLRDSQGREIPLEGTIEICLSPQNRDLETDVSIYHTIIVI